MCRKQILLAFLLITIFTVSLIADINRATSFERVPNQFIILLHDRETFDDFLDDYERYEMKLVHSGPKFPGNKNITLTIVVSFNNEYLEGEILLEIIKNDERVSIAQFVHRLFFESDAPSIQIEPDDPNNQQGLNLQINPNELHPNDPFFSDQCTLKQTGISAIDGKPLTRDIRATKAWRVWDNVLDIIKKITNI